MDKVVAFTGAGISKASGIPTFEELGDIREKLSRDYFKAHPKDFFTMLIEFKKILSEAEPNPAHLALAHYQIPVVTMNIDGLHKRAGSHALIEVHGNLDFVFCKACKEKYDFSILEKSIHCPICRGFLEPNVVLYGDMIYSYSAAINCIASAQLLLVIGTSFYTSTTHMVDYARNKGTKVRVINENAETAVPELLESIFQ